MTKQATYIRALKALPDYFIDEQTRFATVDADMMIVANPQFAPMWYDGVCKHPKWKPMTLPECPFEMKGKDIKTKE